jgi:hypothetical protein
VSAGSDESEHPIWHTRGLAFLQQCREFFVALEMPNPDRIAHVAADEAFQRLGGGSQSIVSTELFLHRGAIAAVCGT